MSRRSVMSYFNREKFDMSHGEIDPYEFHNMFYILMKAFRVVGDDPMPKWTIFTPIIVLFCGGIAAGFCLMSTIQFIKIFEISQITETGTYLVVMTYKVFILTCSITDKPCYHSLLQAMKEDFKYICSEGSKYREKYFENQLWTFQASMLCGIFIIVIGGGMAICAILALIITLLFLPEGTARPLPFPVWAFDVNPAKTPAYECFFVFSLACIVSQCYTYNFMMQVQIVWIRQMISKADIIIWSIEDLLLDVKPAKSKEEKEIYEGIIKVRMGNIIKMHISLYELLDNYSGVYKKLLMFEQKLVSPIVCLTAFCTAEKLDNGEIPGIMLLLCVAVIILVFVPSYMCTKLAEKLQSIGDSCWNTPFWNAPGKVIRPFMVLIMQRSMKPLPIRATGFEDISLETFSKKLTSAYSCFNMLRQADYEMKVSD